MSLIFLDIDGVLNQHDFSEVAKSNVIHREKVAILNRIIDETRAKIILSSAWRYNIHRGDMTFQGMDWLLRSHGIACDTLCGFTRLDTMIHGPDGSIPKPDERGQQITDWLVDHVAVSPKKPGSVRWVVIDDGGIRREDGSWTDMGIVAAGHPFVRTDGKVGLTDADADRAIAILKGQVA